MITQRVEKHRIKPSDKYFAMLDHFCLLSKNLYNHANYILRQAFLNNHKTVSYGDMDKILKADDEYPDYRAMPTAQCAQQVLGCWKRTGNHFSALSGTGQRTKTNIRGGRSFQNIKRKTAGIS